MFEALHPHHRGRGELLSTSSATCSYVHETGIRWRSTCFFHFVMSRRCRVLVAFESSHHHMQTGSSFLANAVFSITGTSSRPYLNLTFPACTGGFVHVSSRTITSGFVSVPPTVLFQALARLSCGAVRGPDWRTGFPRAPSMFLPTNVKLGCTHVPKILDYMHIIHTHAHFPGCCAFQPLPCHLPHGLRPPVCGRLYHTSKNDDAT